MHQSSIAYNEKCSESSSVTADSKRIEDAEPRGEIAQLKLSLELEK